MLTFALCAMMAGLVILALRGILSQRVLDRESQLSGPKSGRARDRTIINGTMNGSDSGQLLKSLYEKALRQTSALEVHVTSRTYNVW